MNVLLVNPQTKRKRLFISPPLGLMYLASAIRDAGHTATIVDLYSFNENFPNLSKFDVVAITGMSFQHSSILETAKKVKEYDKNKIVIVGGPHVSAVPDLMMKNGFIDFVVVGEGEQVLPKLLDSFSLPKKFERRVFYADKNLHLDDLPFPAWDLIDFRKYDSPHGLYFEKFPYAPIVTSRGCPFECFFCASRVLSGGFWRPHSAERVLKEIDILVSEHKIKELHIEDDNFSLDFNRAKQIMRGITYACHNLKIAFPNGIHIANFDYELLQLMRKAGVYSVTVGIESGSPRIQKLINKNLELEFVEDRIKLLKDFGFYVQAFFIVGFPQETREDVQQTIDFALKLDLDAAFFGAFVPLPGSTYFKNLGLNPETINWDNLYSMKPFPSRNLSENDIHGLQQKAYHDFYCRKKILWRNLKRIKSFGMLKALYNRFSEMS